VVLRQYEQHLNPPREKKGPIGKLHNLAKFTRASPQRTEVFKIHARVLQAQDVHKLCEESTAELELTQDSATRWICN
jgi:hypothetical protein